MNRRTQAIIGFTIVGIGIAVVGLGLFDQEAAVRQVDEVLEDPVTYQTGDYTLLGILQPPVMPEGTHSNGTFLANPEFEEGVKKVVSWTQDGVIYHSTHTLRVTGPDAEGTSYWSFTNETREPGRADLSFEAESLEWTVSGPHEVFIIEGFEDVNGDKPRLFGLYRGLVTEPLFVKSSQLDGRLATQIDDTPLPAGAWVFEVDELTQQCSSKFDPMEEGEEGEITE